MKMVPVGKTVSEGFWQDRLIVPLGYGLLEVGGMPEWVFHPGVLSL